MRHVFVAIAAAWKKLDDLCWKKISQKWNWFHAATLMLGLLAYNSMIFSGKRTLLTVSLAYAPEFGLVLYRLFKRRFPKLSLWLLIFAAGILAYFSLVFFLVASGQA